MLTGQTYALTTNQILEISKKVTVLMEQGGDAANRGDFPTACKKAQESAILWFKINPHDVPQHALSQFFASDRGVKNLVVQSFKFCSKY